MNDHLRLQTVAFLTDEPIETFHVPGRHGAIQIDVHDDFCVLTRETDTGPVLLARCDSMHELARELEFHAAS